MTLPTSSPPLGAGALEAFLDETEAALEQQQESGLAPSLIQDNLRAALERHQYRADTFASVCRLAHLWSRAGEFDAAVRLLDGDGQAVLAALQGDEHQDTRLTLALTRVAVLCDSPARALPAAEAAYTLLRDAAYRIQSREAWDYLGSLAGRAGLFELERRCAEGRHAYQAAQPERSAFRAFDKACTALWRAFSYAREGAGAQVQAAAGEAIAALLEAGPEQDLDANDWLYLGDSLVSLAPRDVDTVVERVHALTAAMAAPRRRDIAILAARLQARALYARGALQEALDAAPAGRYAVSCDEDDAFSALVLDWLLEAGRHDQAAALAFECAFNEREVSCDHACRIALAQLAGNGAGGGSNPYWPLVLAWASMLEASAWVVGDQDLEGFFRVHMGLARAAGAAGAAQPAIDAVAGLHMFYRAKDDAAALPLLESAARDPGLANQEVVEKIWLCRMRLHGVERALRMPFVDVASAGWCYNIGVTLQYDTRDALPPGSAWSQEEVDRLAAQYYERGKAQFEHFFATGQGMYRDANAHCYSMLCNNLGIHYRLVTSEYQAAIALHRKGLEASPFAEHYAAIMHCRYVLEDYSGFIDAADQLWRYATEHGYSRHAPTHYILDLASCLDHEGRGLEIPVWLERLAQWWDTLDESEQAEQAGDYWDAVSVNIYYMGRTKEAQSLAHLEAVLPELCAARHPRATRMAANVLCRAGQYERALPMYRQALEQIDPGEEWHAEQRRHLLKEMAECERKLRAGRPWWRFWK